MPPRTPDLRSAGACHDSSLPQWAVDKMIRRRGGQQYAFHDLDAVKTALVVIDLLQGYISGTPCAASIVTPINGLAHALRRAGGLVVWVLPDPAMEEAPILRALWGDGWRAETEPTLADGLETATGDLTVHKQAYSAFFPGKSPLPDLLNARGIDTVLIAGVLTNVCCESSARDAMTLGYRVIMVSDANAARSDEEHRSALYNVMRNFGDVRDSNSLIGVFGTQTAV